MIVIASSKAWHAPLAEAVARRTGRETLFIGDRAEFTAERLASAGAQLVFLPHWSHIVPADIYERFETIIFHMTDLPYGRGGSPLQNLIVRGHEETRLAALRCEAGLDTGPVYLKRQLSLAGTAEEIFLRAAGIIEDMIVEIIEKAPEPAPQSGEPVLFKRRRAADGDWSLAATLDDVYDHIRMLDADGYPPAFVDIGLFRVEFRRASRKFGAVIADATISLRDTGKL